MSTDYDDIVERITHLPQQEKIELLAILASQVRDGSRNLVQSSMVNQEESGRDMPDFAVQSQAPHEDAAPEATAAFYRFKIELLEIKPTIWRRFFVPANSTLELFHDVIQLIMGWENCHLWEFGIEEQRFMPVDDGGFTDFDDSLDPAAYRLHDLMTKKGQIIRYQYDFGDSWMHKLKLEDVNFIRAADDKREVGCLEGARACPPEDVGGVWGYEEFCEVMSKPRTKRYKEMVQWYSGESKGGKPYDPERFDVEEVNRRLVRLPFK